MSIKKRVDWIHYKYPEVGSNIGLVTSSETNVDPLSFLPIIPPICQTEDLPITIAKYVAETMPNVKHVFIIEPFTKDWMEKKYLDRRKRIPQLYLDESMKYWTNVFLDYGIEIYMPFLDRILIQNL